MEQQGNSIVIRNFFRLVRSGAFNEYEPIERMSDFKWGKLFGIVIRQNVMAVAANGIRNSQYDDATNIPKHIVDGFFEMCRERHVASAVSIPQSEMSSRWLNRRLRKIRREERHAPDTSPETLELLNIIVYNTGKLLATGICFGNIILIGKYLRSRGDKVDFVKLERWLRLLRLRDIAEFEGNILISALSFGPDEVPFVHKPDATAYRRAVASLMMTRRNDPGEWLFRQGRSGMVHNNTAALRQNIWHKLKYLRYAPVETASSFLHNIAHGLSQIEE